MSSPGLAPDWRVDSETERLREVLVCRPEHFEWVPTSEIARQSLATGERLDRSVALRQHQALVAALRDESIAVRFLEPDSALVDQCWVRDSSWVSPWGPAVLSLAEPVRSGEPAAIRQFYEQHGQTLWAELPGPIEGGDIMVLQPGLAAIGFSGSRTSHAAARNLATLLEAEGWEVRLVAVPNRFVHLDVLLGIAGRDVALVCDEVLGAEVGIWLEGHGFTTLPVSVSEVEKLACNVLCLSDDRVLASRDAQETNDRMRAVGLVVTALELDAFTSSGGGIHCLTMPLRRDAGD